MEDIFEYDDSEFESSEYIPHEYEENNIESIYNESNESQDEILLNVGKIKELYWNIINEFKNELPKDRKYYFVNNFQCAYNEGNNDKKRPFEFTCGHAFTYQIKKYYDDDETITYDIELKIKLHIFHSGDISIHYKCNEYNEYMGILINGIGELVFSKDGQAYPNMFHSYESFIQYLMNDLIKGFDYDDSGV